MACIYLKSLKVMYDDDREKYYDMETGKQLTQSEMHTRLEENKKDDSRESKTDK